MKIEIRAAELVPYIGVTFAMNKKNWTWHILDDLSRGEVPRVSRSGFLALPRFLRRVGVFSLFAVKMQRMASLIDTEAENFLAILQ